MILAQEKYTFPNQLNQETVADVRQSPVKNSRAEKEKARTRITRGILAIVALFLAGVFVAVTYIYPTQLGYRQVSLEKELAQLEKENKQLELTIARNRSLERVESIAVSRLNMTRPGDMGLMVAAQSPTTAQNPSKAVAANTPAVQQPVKQMVASSQEAANQKAATKGAATQKAANQGMRNKALVMD